MSKAFNLWIFITCSWVGIMALGVAITFGASFLAYKDLPKEWRK